MPPECSEMYGLLAEGRGGHYVLWQEWPHSLLNYNTEHPIAPCQQHTQTKKPQTHRAAHDNLRRGTAVRASSDPSARAADCCMLVLEKSTETILAGSQESRAMSSD
eukprot:CAMPEP_0179443566 /NCGR_PEP_ID=MMETSP0799-20121207/27002_1 /TAXON_ID=46947 /ORGANISM="Geminigera cryophila, Strain CCMP2564" /LENGTH=105 /DNA_ID=CAMNT_0021229717 /DNA_START=408 /DNA_END=723 /DNA_ORIENTATION=+